MYTYMIDGTIDLAQTCNDAGWHHASVIELLQQQGLTRVDATEYADFAFNEQAVIKDVHYDGLPAELKARMQRVDAPDEEAVKC